MHDLTPILKSSLLNAPSHKGIIGNNEADSLVKQTYIEEIIDIPVPVPDIKEHI